jgi:serine/threonine protein kinase
MLNKRINHIKCGEFANESEKKAIEFLKSYLSEDQNSGNWVLFTNLTIKYDTFYKLPLETDILAVGEQGVHVIEIKHWDQNYLKKNIPVIEKEIDKLNNKAKIVADKLRKAGFGEKVGFLAPKFLFTKEKKAKYQSNPSPVKMFGITEWKDLLEINKVQNRFTLSEIKQICSIFVPLVEVNLNKKIQNFGLYSNLNLIYSSDDWFYRVYKARYKTNSDKVILHLYDLSATKSEEPLNLAKREFDVLQKLQKSKWLPSIYDSFQEASMYPGELQFFSYLDPEIPSLNERIEDEKWDIASKLITSKNCFLALKELHENNILHRNLNPQTIKVKSDNEPILTDFYLAKIYDAATIANDININTVKEKNYLAPEILNSNLGNCTSKSDIYSLCLTLLELFPDKSDLLSNGMILILSEGLTTEPQKRPNIEEFINKIEKIIPDLTSDSKEPKKVLEVKYWDQDTVKELNNGKYRIIMKLGSGSFGTTFKVMEIDEKSGEDTSGPYVAKVITNESLGQKATNAYAKVRAHTGIYLADVKEVRKEWSKNEIAALLKWVPGESIFEWKGVLPDYLESLNMGSKEEVLLNWIKQLSQGLSELHKVNLVHGDISPKNIIIDDYKITLTDYDLSSKVGDTPLGGTFRSPEIQQNQPISLSDDIYALACSFFTVVFDRNKENIDSWNEIDTKEYSKFKQFIDKAVSINKEARFDSAMEVINFIDNLNNPVEIENIETINLTEANILKDNEVPRLLKILETYPGSQRGNNETRGLDSDFARETYVETSLDKTISDEIKKGNVNLIIICGNAGDGKTAFLQYLATKLGIPHKESSERFWNHKLTENNLEVYANLDGAASFKEQSAKDLLDIFFEPFMEGWPKNKVHLIAINDGPLLEWLEAQEPEHSLIKELYNLLLFPEKVDDHELRKKVRLIDLNSRSLVGGYKTIETENRELNTEFFNELLDKIIGDFSVWYDSCNVCTAQNKCQVWQSVKSLNDQNTETLIRKKILKMLQAVHFRGEIHITTRLLRAALSYIFFGTDYCEDIHNINYEPEPFWDRAFDLNSKARQDDLLEEISFLDPALETHPRIDKYLLQEGERLDPYFSDNEANLSSLKRWAYFHLDPNKINEIGGSSDSLDIVKGKYINDFLKVGLGDDVERICTDVCKGISQLEDLPEKAFFSEKFIPLRITPRTPTETSFWVNKPRESFSLRPGTTKSGIEGIDFLHNNIILTYKYSDNRTEELIIGLELFHILMELKDGYQLFDVSSDDIFANLAIFKQRLSQEDEREIFSFNPAADEIYKINADFMEEKQKLFINPVSIYI